MKSTTSQSGNKATAIVSVSQERSVIPAVLNEPWATAWWLPRHEQKVAQARGKTAELVLIGDSIIHGWENEGGAVWRQYFADIDTLNLGFSGDRTENVLWRLQQGELERQEPALAILLIGTNNTGHRMDTPEAIRDGVKAILAELRIRIPASPVLLLGIFPRGADSDDSLRINNNKANDLLADLASEAEILFARFDDAFLKTDGTLNRGITPDMLHLNQFGYQIWARQLQPYIQRYVRESGGYLQPMF
ncbi:GDSL-type esterase/lipase family protein [Alteromonas aestuariivivens]|uniref:GDSL-type esterase/lipase family protein n=1 Tax=Alteromonas aestuariivivens TaxID=1938339 RepID=UPI0015F2940B|nr:GDSL-type esterase/lipase family protein [Alteromonas aestuariivivens]